MAIVAQHSKFSKIAMPVLAWVVALIFFFPIFYMLLTSFKTDADAVNLNSCSRLRQRWKTTPT